MGFNAFGRKKMVRSLRYCVWTDFISNGDNNEGGGGNGALMNFDDIIDRRHNFYFFQNNLSDISSRSSSKASL